MPDNLAPLMALVGASALCLISAGIVVVGARDRSISWVVALAMFVLGVWNAQIAILFLPGVGESHPTLIWVLRFSVWFVPAVAFQVGCVFAGKTTGAWRVMVCFGYALALSLCAMHVGGFVLRGVYAYWWGAMGRAGPVYPLFVAYSAVWTLGTLVACAAGLRRTSEPHVRLRTRYLLVGAGPAVALGFLNFLPNYGLATFPFGCVGVILVIAALAYAAVKHRLLQIDVMVMRAGALLFSSLAVVLPVVVLIHWVQALEFLPESVAPMMPVMGILVAMHAHARLRGFMEGCIERSLFPSRHDSRAAIELFSRRVVELTHRDELARELSRSLANGLGVAWAALYVRNGGRGFQLEAVAGDEVLCACLPDDVELDATPSATCEITLPIELLGSRVGFIALGAKTSGAAIDDLDNTLLKMVASQVGIALRNLEHLREIEGQGQEIKRQKAEIEELKKKVEAENVVLRAEVRRHSAFGEIIGSSMALQQALGLVQRAACSQASILIAGETGTGKELIARAIHDLSDRREGPMISVNCPAIPQDLAEAELFGCERGAYTGATESRPGRFEMADGGTIFLDEVSDLPMSIQTKLLRVLQEREVQRLGSRRALKLDVRVVAASNRDLRAAIARGEFREDLYHRLAGIVAELPPLRERAGDIDVLATYFLGRAATTYQKPVIGFTAEALSVLRSYNWPGNIRELQNVVERAVLLCEQPVIAAPHLGDLAVTPAVGTGLALSIREEKARRIQQALTESGGNQAEAARRLGLSRSNLARMIKNLGIKSPRTLQ